MVAAPDVGNGPSARVSLGLAATPEAVAGSVEIALGAVTLGVIVITVDPNVDVVEL